MFEGMKVVSKGEIAVGLFTAAVLGGAVSTIAGELLAKPVFEKPIRPVVERRTANETIAKIPTHMNGRDVMCELRIDHKQRSWSLSC